MEAAGAVGAAWSAASGWLTPAVLFVAVNLVIATIAVASRLMPSSAAAPGGGDDAAAAGEPTRGGLLLRAPSFLAVDRLRSSFSFSRLGHGLAPDHAPPLAGEPEPEPSLPQRQPAAEANQQQPEAERRREEARVERSRSEAAAALAEAPGMRRRPRARRAAAEVEVDARADDFIRRFREQLRLQRLDSLLRYRDRERESLRRTGTA